MTGSPRELAARFLAARADPSLVVLEGFHALKHAVRFGAGIELAATADRAAALRLAERHAPDIADQLRGLVEEAPPAVFEKLAPVPPATGVVAIARRPVADVAALLLGDPRRAPLVLLESPSDLGNVGAAVRVAAAAGAAGVLTTGRHDPWHPAALRGSAGLHFALPVARVDGVPAGARPLVAVHPQGGRSLENAAVPGDAILAFGAERAGLSAELLARAERRVSSPMRPGVSSLNLATAVAVALYAWRLGPAMR